MKKIIYLLPLIILLGACTQKTGYKVSGTATNSSDTQLFLEKLSNTKKEVIDTVTLGSDGVFLMEGPLDQAGMFRIRNNKRRGVLVHLKPGSDVNVQIDFDNLKEYAIEGSPETIRFKEFGEFYTQRKTDKQQLVREYRSESDSLTKANMLEQLQGWDEETNEMIKTKINEEPSALLGVFMISALQAQQNKAFYNDFNDRLQLEMPNSDYAKDFNALVAEVNSRVTPPSIGEKAPEIAMANADGEIMKLSDLEGKYVLLDFWAAWCGPCRRENPNIVQAYNNYKDQGFEIYSVSLDKTPQAWQRAIQQDNLTWDYHVSDLKFWNNAAAKKYGVKSIPASFLLDKNGKIIAKNLRGPALDAKLGEIFN